MAEYKIQVKLVTEAIFGSGHSIPGSVDLEVVYDECGLPYMKAKTFKGNFREAMDDIVNEIGKERYSFMIDELLGKSESGINQWKTLNFSDLRLPENIRNTIKKATLEDKLQSGEVMEALTDVRSFTSVDEEGSTIKGSLRQMRVIKKDITLEVDLHTERKLTEEELGLLSMTSRYLRHIGTMRTRGKGEIDCTFLEKCKDVYIDNTDKYIDEFIKGVKINA